MSDELEEVTDFKKVGIIIIGVTVVAIGSMYFLMPENFTIPDVVLELPQIEMPKAETTSPNLRDDYKVFVGEISEDDVIDFQNLDCSIILGNSSLISNDKKYDEVIAFRQSECN